MRGVFLVLMTFCTAISSYGQSISTGQDLHDGWVVTQRIQSGNGPNISLNDEALTFLFVGYVQGITDLVQETKMFVFPKGTNNAQFVAIVGKYLDSHPEEWNLKASSLVLKALRAVYGPK